MSLVDLEPPSWFKRTGTVVRVERVLATKEPVFVLFPPLPQLSYTVRRPEYTASECFRVAYWLNGYDQSLSNMVSRGDDPNDPQRWHERNKR